MAATSARSDVTAFDDSQAEPPVTGPRSRLRAVEPATPLEVADESCASLVRSLEKASAVLTRLSASAPVVTSGAFVVRAVSVPRAGAAVLTSIDARRAVLTTRDADGAVASWLADGERIVARLPPGENVRLGGGLVVTVNEAERALLVAHGRRARHGIAVLALALDLSTVDVYERRSRAWFGFARARPGVRSHRHVIDAGRPAPVTRQPRSAGPIARGQAGDVVVPPGMAARDASRLDAERRRFARERGERDAAAGLPARALVDVHAFLAAASERFLEGPHGATRVLDASPVLYGILVRYHGVSHVMR